MKPDTTVKRELTVAIDERERYQRLAMGISDE